MNSAALFNSMILFFVVFVMSNRVGVIDAPDQYVYGLEKEKTESIDAILLINQGKIGRFNRVQRSYFNTLEFLPLFILNTLLIGYLLPKFSFNLSMWFVIGRILYSIGYSLETNIRFPGFLLQFFCFGLSSTGIVLISLVISGIVSADVFKYFFY